MPAASPAFAIELLAMARDADGLQAVRRVFAADAGRLAERDDLAAEE
jgi:hypothetical protein